MTSSPAPVVVAHRGSRFLWPENTMAAFAGAVATGAQQVETDLRVTSDGVVVCIHDTTVDRTTDGSGHVSQLDFARISRLDAGSRHRGPEGFSHRGEGLAVPALAELVTSFPALELVLDIKTPAVIPGLVGIFASHKLYDRAVVGSFRESWLRDIRRMSGGRIRTSVGAGAVRRWLAAPKRRPAPHALHVPLQYMGVRVVDDRLLDSARRAGVPVYVWTVNQPSEMRRLMGLGVTGIVTDRPDLARSLQVAS